MMNTVLILAALQSTGLAQSNSTTFSTERPTTIADSHPLFYKNGLSRQLHSEADILETARKLDGLGLIAAAASSSSLNSLDTSVSSVELLWDEPLECINGGAFDEQRRVCVNCTEGYGGARCETPRCLNGGVLDANGRTCHCIRHQGLHCQWPDCEGGTLNQQRNACECIGNYFGRYCELFCWHGQLTNGFCACYEGYEGVTCSRCESQAPGGLPATDCAEQLRQRRRPVMQSRFALSGLSLCLITIILLWISVVSRRRRSMLAAAHLERMANERLLRDRQLRRGRSGDLAASATPVLLAASLPRSRGGEFRLFAASTVFGGVGRCAELRPSSSSSASRGQRRRAPGGVAIGLPPGILGRPFFRSMPEAVDSSESSRANSESPPPIYCSTDNLQHGGQLEAPPTYEEAILRNEESEQFK